MKSVITGDRSGPTNGSASETAHASPDPMPRWLLAALCVAIVALAILHDGHSIASMDGRTHLQMMRAIADHGLPYWENGPIDQSAALVVPWGVPVHGHIWGIYSPLYAYLAAPVFRLGGLKAVSSFGVALLVPLAIAVFLLARRFVESEWYALFAAALTVLATPITGHALDVSPFPLVALLVTLGSYFAVRALTSPTPSLRSSFFCGLTWAAACAGHIVSIPMCLSSLALLGAAPPSRSVTRTQRFVPALFAFGLGLAPVAYLNHLRFGTYNPISYGPIPWTNGDGEGLKMNLVAELRYSAIAMVFVVAIVATLWLLRHHAKRKPAISFLVVALAAVVAVVVPQLRERFVRYAAVGCGFVVDMTILDLGPAYVQEPDGVGHRFVGWIVKSTLQCTPALILAPLALRGARARERLWAMLAVLVPSAALFASFLARANLSNIGALGWPWVHLRYTFPALPGLVVASVVATERLRPRPRHAVLALGVASIALVAFLLTAYDHPLWKRLAILILPLAIGAVTFAFALGAERMKSALRHAATLAATLWGLSVAIAMGHDFYADYLGKNYVNAFVDELDPRLPHRFALVGALGEFDGALSTIATHDVHYADLLRLSRYEDIYPLIQYWRADARPIYFLAGQPPHSSWPDVSFRRVNDPGAPLGLFLVEAPRSAQSP